MAIFEFKTRVSYDDIGNDMALSLRGAMGMMQEAAIIHSDMIGYSINDIERTQVIWMLVQWHVQMVEKAYWNDRLTVTTWPTTMERATSERDFKIVDEHGRTVALGESVWVLVSAQTGRIIRIPPHVAQAYDLTRERAFDHKFEEPVADAGAVLAFTGEVYKRDIDTNHHVNNRVYLDYALEALPDEMSQISISDVFVRYHKQLMQGQRFCCMYKKCGDTKVVDICGADEAVTHAHVVFR